MAQFEVPRGQRQLFLDDVGIARMENLERIMHRPVKRGPVLTADRPSDGEGPHSASAPMWVESEKQYKLVYEIRDREVKRYGLATSTDGINWQKPFLGLVEFDGSTDNNLFPTPDNKRIWHVVNDPDDADETRRFKGFLTVKKGRIPVVSPDLRPLAQAGCGSARAAFGRRRHFDLRPVPAAVSRPAQTTWPDPQSAGGGPRLRRIHQ